MDLHRIYEGFNPLPDGESPVRHRTGIVDVVNADGTVDVDLGGTVIPNVSVLSGVSAFTGEVVQVLVWAGDLLVIGGIGAPSGVCQVRRLSQSIANNTTVTIAYNSEADMLDPLDWHEGVTNPSRVTPTIAGWYRAHVGTEWQSDTDYTRQYVQITRNGAALSPICRQETADDFSGAAYYDLTSPLILMNGTTDYLEVSCFQTNASAGANTVASIFDVELVLSS